MYMTSGGGEFWCELHWEEPLRDIWCGERWCEFHWEEPFRDIWWGRILV